MAMIGYNSTDTDSCLRLLGARNAHHLTQYEAGRALLKAFSHKVCDAQEMSDRLGVALWVIRQGLVVAPAYLSQAYLYAKRLIANDEYLDSFCPPTRRFAVLQREVELLQELISQTGLYN